MSKRIVLVEDNQAIAEMYRLQLEIDGYKVEWYGDAESGLAAIQAAAPDLVLMDIRLPGMDGLECLSLIKNGGNQGPPVIMVTNFGDPDLMAKARQLGAADFLVKSSTAPPQLSKRIKEILS